MAAEGTIHVACDRMECGPIELVPIGRRQVVRFYTETCGGPRQICEAVLTWPDTLLADMSVGLHPPTRGPGD